VAGKDGKYVEKETNNNITSRREARESVWLGEDGVMLRLCIKDTSNCQVQIKKKLSIE